MFVTPQGDLANTFVTCPFISRGGCGVDPGGGTQRGEDTERGTPRGALRRGTQEENLGVQPRDGTHQWDPGQGIQGTDFGNTLNGSGHVGREACCRPRENRGAAAEVFVSVC